MKTVLYYAPEDTAHVAALKGVFVRLGIRIKNIGSGQIGQTVGYLVGMPGFEAATETDIIPEIREEVLVMKEFTGRDIDILIRELRKAGVPKINLKAVVTESNSRWTFYELYQEIKEEHEKLSQSETSRP